jgi:hypothetical protein
MMAGPSQGENRDMAPALAASPPDMDRVFQGHKICEGCGVGGVGGGSGEMGVGAGELAGKSFNRVDHALLLAEILRDVTLRDVTNCCKVLHHEILKPVTLRYM